MVKKKLTVGLFTYDFYPIIGGQGKYAYELYKELFNNDQIDFLVFSPRENNLGNHFTIFPETSKSKLKNIDFSIRLSQNIKKIIKNYNIDIIHLQGGPGGVLLFTNLKNIPILYTAHHTYWQQQKFISEQKWKVLLYHLEKKAYKSAQLVICDVNSTKNVLIHEYGLKNIAVIPLGISKDFLEDKGNNSTGKEILYIGRIDKRKGVDFLISAMELVNSIDSDIKLHIIGKGVDKEKLFEYARLKSLNIMFHDFLPDEQVNEIYKNVKAQIVPSRFEGFGLTILEGMSKKVPIIGTNTPGVKDIIEHNNTGILVEFGDINTLATEIVRLIKDERLRKKIIQNAYNNLEKYTWKALAEETLNLYKISSSQS